MHESEMHRAVAAKLSRRAMIGVAFVVVVSTLSAGLTALGEERSPRWLSVFMSGCGGVATAMLHYANWCRQAGAHGVMEQLRTPVRSCSDAANPVASLSAAMLAPHYSPHSSASSNKIACSVAST